MPTVTVQFDPDNPEMALTVEVPANNATVRWVKEELCRQDFTGTATPESFRLFALGHSGALLDDGTPITPGLETLVLQPSDPEQEAREEADRKMREEFEREEREMALFLIREEEERKAREERTVADRKAKKEEAERLAKMQVEGGGPIIGGGPSIYLCATNSLFLKKSSNPRSGKIVKQKRDPGSQVQSTGRTWTGPSGGLWAELTPSAETSKEEGWDHAWALVDGPGFGLDGPALIDPDHPPEPPAVSDDEEREAAMEFATEEAWTDVMGAWHEHNAPPSL
mmetsp:Transcript_19073/g.44858  ORF Transcript_19073/g.44858 Transcript_19073/m.44858 type:complete len:282 (-) Transcript_19073:466-1311(-)